MMPLLLSFVFITIITLCAAGFYIINQERQKKKRMLEVIQGKAQSGLKQQANPKDEQNKRRAAMAEKLKEAKEEDPDQKAKKKTPIGALLIQAGIKTTTKQFFLFSAIFTLIVFFILKLMKVSPALLIMGCIIAFFGIPKIVLKKLIANRQKAFLEEFPDALEASVRLLKAGMPVSEAIQMISNEFTGPTGEEMSRIYDQQKIGVPLHEAAQAATKRMPLPEMQMFATGLAIQAQTGASLSEVLMNLSGVIRARFRLKRKVKALSSEAIASASIIGALPILVTLGLYFSNREYIEVLFEDTFGQVLLGGAIIWMCIGMFVMKIMINFKV